MTTLIGVSPVPPSKNGEIHRDLTWRRYRVLRQQAYRTKVITWYGKVVKGHKHAVRVSDTIPQGFKAVKTDHGVDIVEI